MWPIRTVAQSELESRACRRLWSLRTSIDVFAFLLALLSVFLALPATWRIASRLSTLVVLLSAQTGALVLLANVLDPCLATIRGAETGVASGNAVGDSTDAQDAEAGRVATVIRPVTRSAVSRATCTRPLNTSRRFALIGNSPTAFRIDGASVSSTGGGQLTQTLVAHISLITAVAVSVARLVETGRRRADVVDAFVRQRTAIAFSRVACLTRTWRSHTPYQIVRYRASLV